jgi:hypothetical protein
MVYGRENINTLAAVLSANPPADLPLRLRALQEELLLR